MSRVLLVLVAALQLHALLWLCPLPASAQLLLPGLVLPAIPSSCTLVPGTPGFSDTLTRTVISNTDMTQVLQAASLDDFDDVNTVAYHLYSSDCGVQLYSTVGGTEDNQQPTTPTFTLNGTAAQSFVVLQPLSPTFDVPQGVGGFTVDLFASMGSISVYDTADLLGVQVALLNCPDDMFGVQASAISTYGTYSLGPTIPAACAEVVGTPFVDGPSFNLTGDSGGMVSYAVTASGSVQANAVAVHVLGSNFDGSEVFVSVDYNRTTGTAIVSPYGPAAIGVYVAPLQLQFGTSITLQGGTVELELDQNQLTNPGPFLFGGSEGNMQLQLLYCDPSAFTPQGGAVPAVVCPVPVSSSSTSAAAFSDPRFRGFWGQSFYVEGVVGGVYSLLSSQAVQVNARFTYRSNVSCPQQDGHDVSNCFQEAGTYFGSLAVRASTGDWLRVVGGGVAAGFAEVSINGQRPVQVGDSVDVGHTQGQGSGEDTATTTLASTTTTTTTTTTSLPSAETSLRAGPQLARLQQLLRGAGGVEGVDGVDGAAAAGQPHALRSSSPQVQQAAAASSTSPSLPLLHVTRLSARQLRVQAGDYTLHIDNMDGYVDLSAVDVQCWACLEQGHLSLDGLLGQTWQATARIVHDVEGVEQFRVVGDDEAGCSSAVHDRHCSAA